MIKMIVYPKCSTCIKAMRFLDTLNIPYEMRHIVEDKLSKEELKELHQKSGLPLKRFFNTSGLKYKELKLKEVLPTLSEDAQYDLLASDGMLVKRPILVSDSKILVGFKEDEYRNMQ